ncbi:hypothetical protein LEP1GSC168_1441 [Leptospira santarosai str. HAI134]|nr:hypothetical protein LEP1GSC169_2067 [Leptospira santarosai str. HAI1349]EMO21694.1 hypothetical protein LEP1GSC168_1441 [Leptospira santarosai str. HAI134]EMO32345.1 hypothetical protein LEP1GSC175_0618 [Leptospira santarosai str. HAI821]
MKNKESKSVPSRRFLSFLEASFFPLEYSKIRIESLLKNDRVRCDFFSMCDRPRVCYVSN